MADDTFIIIVESEVDRQCNVISVGGSVNAEDLIQFNLINMVRLSGRPKKIKPCNAGLYLFRGVRRRVVEPY